MNPPILGDVRSIAIVGAGIGGMTVANALVEAGFEATVFEQARSIERVGAGIQLGANATAVLEPLGLLERLLPLACTPLVSRAFEWNTGRVVSETPLGGGAYRTPYVQAHRADVHAVLFEALPSETVQLAKRLVALDDTGDRVALGFEDGTTASADFVIGADGIHSVVQKYLFGEHPLTFAGWASHRGIVDAKDVVDLGFEVIAAKWMAPDRHLMHYFVSGGKELAFVASLPQETATAESWSRESDKNEVLDALAGFHPTVLELVSRCERIQKWAIYDRNIFLTWSRGRVTLLGDACHAMRPFMSQGAGMALEDGAVLTRALTEFPKSMKLCDVLGVYEATRKPRTAWMQSGSMTHALRQSYQDSPSPAEYIYSYDAWRDELNIPPRIRSFLRSAGRGTASA